MQAARKARIYDRLVDGEGLQGPKRRFAEVDVAAEALRPGAVVVLSSSCDELLAARHNSNGNWTLSTIATEWSSRGASGWHTHATDYAVESLEAEYLFRVLRDGPRIALASMAADGKLLCSNGSGDGLALLACTPGAWVASGASWEKRDGGIWNSRWPTKVQLGLRILHVTCLPTMQLQRVEEYYGGLMHEVHAQKAVALRQMQEMEQQRDAARADAAQWREQHELVQERLEMQQQQLDLHHREQQQREREREQLAAAQSARTGSTLDRQSAGGQHPDFVAAQLAAVQQQLEHLAADSDMMQLQQERARMSICLRTIKELTDLVRQSATPSCTSSQSVGMPEERPASTTEPQEALTSSPPHPLMASSPEHSPGHEGRVVDYLGSRPEAADPMARVLDPVMPPPRISDTPPKRAALRSLTNSSVEGGSPSPDVAVGKSLDSAAALGGSRKCAARRSTLDSLSLAVRALAVGSPRQADGVAQFLATGHMPLRASQQLQKLPGHARMRSSFLKRPPAAAEDLYPLYG